MTLIVKNATGSQALDQCTADIAGFRVFAERHNQALFRFRECSNPCHPFRVLLQKGLPALEALLLRRQGVDSWTTEDVVSWLRDIGLWSDKTEREVSCVMPYPLARQ